MIMVCKLLKVLQQNLRMDIIRLQQNIILYANFKKDLYVGYNLQFLNETFAGWDLNI